MKGALSSCRLAPLYEPADVIITRFDNASATAPMKFITQYLLDGDQTLIELL